MAFGYYGDYGFLGDYGNYSDSGRRAPRFSRAQDDEPMFLSRYTDEEREPEYDSFESRAQTGSIRTRRREKSESREGIRPRHEKRSNNSREEAVSGDGLKSEKRKSAKEKRSTKPEEPEKQGQTGEMPAYFNKQTQQKFAGLNQETQKFFLRVAAKAEAEGLEVEITPNGGKREYSDQVRIYEESVKKADRLTRKTGKYHAPLAAKPGNSKHESADATDVRVRRKGGEWQQFGAKTTELERVGQIAKAEGGEWGGDWKNQNEWWHIQRKREDNSTAVAHAKPKNKKKSHAA